MEDIIYLRPSGINTYRECSAKYYFQNVERVQVPNKLALAFGTSVHKTLQVNYEQKINTRKDISIEEAKDVFSSAADEEFASVDPSDFEDEKPGQLKDAGLELIEKYQKEVAYRIQPAAVEQKIQVKFKGYDYGLTGTIDLVDEDNIIVDHKTTGKAVTEIPDTYRLQIGGAYPLLFRSLKGFPPVAARADFLCRKSLKNNFTSRIIFSYFSKPQLRHRNLLWSLCS